MMLSPLDVMDAQMIFVVDMVREGGLREGGLREGEQ